MGESDIFVLLSRGVQLKPYNLQLPINNVSTYLIKPSIVFDYYMLFQHHTRNCFCVTERLNRRQPLCPETEPTTLWETSFFHFLKSGMLNNASGAESKLASSVCVWTVVSSGQTGPAACRIKNAASVAHLSDLSRCIWKKWLLIIQASVGQSVSVQPMRGSWNFLIKCSRKIIIARCR